MKKSLFIALLTAAVVTFAAEAEKDYSDYLKVASDLGKGPTVWTMTSGCINPTIKKLNLEVEPADVKAAAIEYEIKNNAYDPKTQKYVNKVDYPWSKLIVRVNGKTVYDGPAGKYIRRGTHRLDIDPKLLKAGENTIFFTWRAIANKDKGKITYGYIYFAVDKTDREVARRSKPRKDWGNPHNDDIRIRLLIKL